MKINIILLVVFSLFFVSCSKKDVVTETVINEKKLDLQVLEAYKEGMSALEGGDVLFAAKKFNEAEILFPQSEWAPKSALMAAYSYYTQDYYYDAIYELERFIRIYSFHKDISYAYYLMAISYYEQIVDEKKDTGSILEAKKYFNIVVQEFPGTEYELDAQFKLELIDDILASKEMYVGRYYFQKNKWIPAINRFKSVIEDYDTTIYVEEALHRLVEIYYILGLTEEAKKYAQVLGYNYQSSEWYEKSYSVFDKKYEKNMKKKVKKEKVKNNFLIKKFKSLFE